MSANALRPNGPLNNGQKTTDKYRCKIGGEWRPWSSFSKKQQKLVQDKLDQRVSIDHANSGMVCRVHSGEPVKEIRCEGPCDKIQVLDQFSKNNRTKGVNICKSCQHWINTQEPGYTPWAGPNTQLDPLEDTDDYETRLPTEPSDIFDFHSEAERPLAPVTGTNGITVPGNVETKLQSLSINDSASHKITAPTLGIDSTAFANRKASSVISNNTETGSESLLKGPNIWFTHAKIAQSYRSGIEYNAYDSTGQQHLKTKTHTVQSGHSSTMSSMAAASNSHAQTDERGRPQRASNAQAHNPARVVPSGPWPGDRQRDRKQLTEQEHRDLQRNRPSRQPVTVPYGNYDDDDDDE
ncbi:hypothetical protein CORC01_07047 [Colletotrichum orchidophilum]|uniref:Stc1 domain-containing protein n=1 Tax=Colletotrichum orchidophilum TaxID=1209926 RepID=A0A1G4B8N5_9PEZI|nr:uncharacterized protein CORC01_07047 [Colletotrichum orchidophilum]OHE97632.1 hypothetical protein CORC01_07047 [Colletotrichum orchidophilum]